MVLNLNTGSFLEDEIITMIDPSDAREIKVKYAERE